MRHPGARGSCWCNFRSKTSGRQKFRFSLACVASVSSERKAIFCFLAAREVGRAQKRVLRSPYFSLEMLAAQGSFSSHAYANTTNGGKRINMQGYIKNVEEARSLFSMKILDCLQSPFSLKEREQK